MENENHFQVAVRTGKDALVETDGFPPLRERICEAESFKYVVTRWLETSGARPYYRTASFLLYRKLLSCKAKNAPRGCALRRIR